MTVFDYLDKYCDNNKAEFARLFGRLPQNVTPIFNDADKWVVIIEEKKHYLALIKNTRKL